MPAFSEFHLFLLLHISFPLFLLYECEFKMEVPTTQKAAVKQGYGDKTTIVVKDIPVPAPSPDEILVKIN